MIITTAGAVLIVAAVLTFIGLRDQVVFFVAPSEIAEKAQTGQRIRLGGLVVEGSLARDADGALRFDVSDSGPGIVAVRYAGEPPALFREGQGVVAEGVWRGGDVFVADRILARHDENYMPREVAEALKERGEWKGAAPP